MEHMAVLHITEAELARDLHAVLEKVRQGAEVVIEQDERPVAVLKATVRPRRKLSEIAAALPEHSTATLDADYASDVEAFIDRHRDPLHPPDWD